MDRKTGAAPTKESEVSTSNSGVNNKVVHFPQTAPLAFPLKVKIYSDGADLESMLSLAKNSMVSGLTTNPTLMRKAGVKEYRTFCQTVLEAIKDKPISFEVLADDFKEMERQALEIASWAPNVYVKIPITNTQKESSCPLMAKLASRGVQINATAILTLPQVVETCEALKHGPPSVVSVFAGRIADAGVDPVPVMQAAREICRAICPDSQLLWASPREVFNILQADASQVDIITITGDLMAKLSLLGKNLGDVSLDTVKMFRNDAVAAGYTL